MNALVPSDPSAQDELMRVLENSLYPGAKPESIALVLSYCRVNSLDPMLKPVHIVPTNVKVASNPDKWERRDVLMPGIADYRIKASRSGDYVGKSEPEFGPDIKVKWPNTELTVPLWCKVTVHRYVHGAVRSFTAREYWRENYATTSRSDDSPNTMWRKRPYGQLAKCCEAQALRQAFPEFGGGSVTAEEMEGKTLDNFGGPTLDHEATPPAESTPPLSRRESINAEVPIEAPARPRQTIAGWLEAMEIALKDAGDDRVQVDRILFDARSMQIAQTLRNGALQRYNAMKAAAIQRANPAPPPEEEVPEDGWPGPDVRAPAAA
jgi:phage recombination protein Bet